jgi:anthranilate synthase/aminodeoxychorismate synthase-like glutamine amidotransferase
MVLVIDNYDSFTYNLVQYLGSLGAEPIVRRNDEITAEDAAAMAPAGILLSPGPCTPRESGVCLDILAAALDGPLNETPIFGVCLGHQAIAHACGATVGAAKTLMHGKTSEVRHDGAGLFEGLPNPLTVCRYHSLAAFEETLPDELEATARTEDGEVMALRHRSRPIVGVQFHPESAFTDQGMRMVQNWLRMLPPAPASHLPGEG